MRNSTRRIKERRNKDKFKFTNDIDLNKPYAGYHICIEDFLSRFGVNDVILYKKKSVSRYYFTKIFVPLTNETTLFVWVLFILMKIKE